MIFSALASGILLGLSAGLAPGPMLALVLAQTLRHGAREGCKVALTPLLTDAPIILLTWILATNVTEVRWLLGIMSIAGGVFVMFLAWEGFRTVPVPSAVSTEHARSWLKGILTNLLNPHPWLFWLTVGAATLGRCVAQSWLAAGAFLGGFYLLLVGSKIVLALLTTRSRNLLGGRAYRLVMRILAVLLVIFALALFREGVVHLAS